MSATPEEVMVLSAFLERPTVGPLHLCERLGLGGSRLQAFVATVDDLRERGLLSAPADHGTDFWRVTLRGRHYLAGDRSELVRAILGDSSPRLLS